MTPNDYHAAVVVVVGCTACVPASSRAGVGSIVDASVDGPLDPLLAEFDVRDGVNLRKPLVSLDRHGWLGVDVSVATSGADVTAGLGEGSGAGFVLFSSID